MAADLGAGEKERGTLSGLLSMPVRRSSIVAGKYLAIALTGTMGLISFMCGTALAFLVNPGFFGRENIRLSMDPGCAALAAGAALLLVMLFSAIELAISLLARSVREAQIIFVPVLMTAMASGYGAFFLIRRLCRRFSGTLLSNLSLAVKPALRRYSGSAMIMPPWPGVFLHNEIPDTALFLLAGKDHSTALRDDSGKLLTMTGSSGKDWGNLDLSEMGFPLTKTDEVISCFSMFFSACL
jgi:hypothetical protein